MMEQLKSDLLQDQVLEEARRLRGRRRDRRILAVIVPLCAAVLAFWPKQEPEVIVSAPVSAEEPEPFVTLRTEEELLDRLAHLGPVLVTSEDGTQWLYLTRQ